MLLLFVVVIVVIVILVRLSWTSKGFFILHV